MRIQWVRRPGPEADHSPPSAVEVFMAWCLSTGTLPYTYYDDYYYYFFNLTKLSSLINISLAVNYLWISWFLSVQNLVSRSYLLFTEQVLRRRTESWGQTTTVGFRTGPSNVADLGILSLDNIYGHKFCESVVIIEGVFLLLVQVSRVIQLLYI
jgi:hypothetical protein